MSDANVWVSGKTRTGLTVSIGGANVDELMASASALGIGPGQMQALFSEAIAPSEGQAATNVQNVANGQVVEQQPQPQPQGQPQAPAQPQGGQPQPPPQGQPQQPHWPHTQGEWQQAANGEQIQPQQPYQPQPQAQGQPPSGWYEGQQAQQPQPAPQGFGQGEGGHPRCAHGPARGPINGKFGAFYACALDRNNAEACRPKDIPANQKN